LTNSEKGVSFSQTVIALMKGVIYREENGGAWQDLLNFQAPVRDYTAILGLELILDEAEGYAFLRQRSTQAGEEELFRLVPRRQLGFSVSLLLALLRKKLVEFDRIERRSATHYARGGDRQPSVRLPARHGERGPPDGSC